RCRAAVVFSSQPGVCDIFGPVSAVCGNRLGPYIVLLGGEEIMARKPLRALFAATVGLMFWTCVSLAPSASASGSGVLVNEVNCSGTDWVELYNPTGQDVSISDWLLTDDPLDRDPLRE